MGRPFPKGRRRRPGQRPPNRYSDRHGTPQPQGFSAGGFRTYHNLIAPRLKGREKRELFNEVAGWMVLAFAVGGAMIGYSCFGVLGAIFGLGAGIAAGGSTVRKGRFYRP